MFLMKFKHYIIAVLAFCATAQIALAQSTKQPKATEVDVTVFEPVLATAKWANFKYEEHLLDAKKGDYKATLKLLEFSGTVDGVEALNHSVTLLELLKSGGDIPFAAAVNMSKTTLKKVLLDRLQLAQGRTKKLELQKPMAEWAPTTWDVLNGKIFDPKVEPGQEQSCMDKIKGEQLKLASPVTDDFGNPVEASPSSGEKASPASNEKAGAEKPKGKQ